MILNDEFSYINISYIIRMYCIMYLHLKIMPCLIL